MNYKVGDYLIRLKNSALAGNKKVTVSATKQILAISKTLERLGFLDGVEKKDGLVVASLTFKNKKPRILDVRLISKPGRRVYADTRVLDKIRKPSIYLISTPQGVISTKEAVKKRVGGEIIAEIW